MKCNSYWFIYLWNNFLHFAEQSVSIWKSYCSLPVVIFYSPFHEYHDILMLIIYGDRTTDLNPLDFYLWGHMNNFWVGIFHRSWNLRDRVSAGRQIRTNLVREKRIRGIFWRDTNAVVYFVVICWKCTCMYYTCTIAWFSVST